MDSDEFTLEIEGEAPAIGAQMVSNQDRDRRHLVSGQAQVSGSVGLTSTIWPHAPRLIAEDPEKRRIVGRPAQTAQRQASPTADAFSEAVPPALASPAPAPPAPTVFEGFGLTEVGTLKKSKQEENEEDEDEFSYALEGGMREEGFHKRVFRPKAMPAHLVSNVKQRLNTEVLAEEEEEEEESKEEEDEEEGDADAGTDDGQGQDGEAEADEGEEDDDKQQQRFQSGDKHHRNSWTTFAVSEGQAESLADVSDPAKPLDAEAQPQASQATPPPNSPPAEDLPSYKLMQVLHVTGSPSMVPSSACASRAAEHVSPVPTTTTTTATMMFYPSCSGGGGSSVQCLTNASRIGGVDVGSHHPLSQEHPFHAVWATEAPPAGGAEGRRPRGQVTTQTTTTTLSDGTGAAAANQRTTAAPEATAVTATTTIATGKPGASPCLQQKNGAKAAATTAATTAATATAATTATALEDEWEAANRERQREQQASQVMTGAVGGGPGGNAAAPLSYHKALLHFMTMDITALRPNVIASLPPPPGFFSRLLCLGPPPLKPPVLREQLLQLLALARLPFDDNDAMHVRLLGALYGTFTGKTHEPPRYGTHWAELGFQGQDPATDLRGCGMLGLLQLYYLAAQWSPEAASKMLRLSQHPVQEFPLAIVSLNVTKWTLQALRSGHLHHAANIGGSLVEATQQFYVGCMATFYTTWLTGSMTMTQSGHVLRNLEVLALKNTGLMLETALREDLPDPPPV